MTMFAIMFLMFVGIVFMIEMVDVQKEKDKRFKK